MVVVVRVAVVTMAHANDDPVGEVRDQPMNHADTLSGPIETAPGLNYRLFHIPYGVLIVASGRFDHAYRR